MDDFADSKTALVADVDCTAGGQSLCEKHGIKGYPSIKYGDPSDLQEYNGGRTLSDLKKFAEENLGPTCGPNNLDLCDADDKKKIAKFQKMDVDELDMDIEELDAKQAAIQKSGDKIIEGLNKKVQDLQTSITKAKEKRDKALAKVNKESGLAWMRAIAKKRRGDDEKTEDDEGKGDNKEEL